MVPIQIYSGTNDSRKVIWQNPAPSSTRHCRPIKFVFAKESIQLITTEVKKVEDQITALLPTKILVNGIEVLVKVNFEFLHGGWQGLQCCFIMPVHTNVLFVWSETERNEHEYHFTKDRKQKLPFIWTVTPSFMDTVYRMCTPHFISIGN